VDPRANVDCGVQAVEEGGIDGCSVVGRLGQGGLRACIVIRNGNTSSTFSNRVQRTATPLRHFVALVMSNRKLDKVCAGSTEALYADRDDLLAQQPIASRKPAG